MAFISISPRKALNQDKIKPAFESALEPQPDQVLMSESAIARIRVLLESEQPGSVLRVGVQGGGCSGLKPYFAFENSSASDDHLFEANGVSICVDPRSFKIIGGSWLDFDNGFKIRSSNLKKSCSCGESFTL